MTGLALNFLRRWTRGQSAQNHQQAAALSLPAEVPERIREAYEQAAFLLQHSPRASGALSRYCLQQLVRHYWELSADEKGPLSSELDRISDRLFPETQASIDCVRQFSSIESQLSQHRDVMVDTTVEEAKILIVLVKVLAQEWYVERSNRQKHYDTIRTMAAGTKRKPAKQSAKETILPDPHSPPAGRSPQKSYNTEAGVSASCESGS